MHQRLVPSALILLTSLLAFSGPASGQQTIWFSPLDIFNPVTTVVLTPGLPSTALRITAPAAPADAFVHLGLTLPSNATIQGVTVCYESSSLVNYISQTRLTRMTTPDATFVVLDDPTDHNLVLLECYSVATSVPVDGTITLSLRLQFTNNTDWIEIGAIGIRVMTTAGIEDPPAIPDAGAALRLHQNHPNPFNPTTLIEYDVVRDGEVELRVYNPTGQLVRTLVDRPLAGGRHAVEWDGRDDTGRALPSGAYYYRLIVGGEEASKQMVLLK